MTNTQALILVLYGVPTLVSCVGTVVEAFRKRGRILTFFDGYVRLTMKLFFARGLVPCWNAMVALSYFYRAFPFLFEKKE